MSARGGIVTEEVLRALGIPFVHATAPAKVGALTIPDHVLEHRAVLSTPDGEPFSEVVDTYTGEVLNFPPPK